MKLRLFGGHKTICPDRLSGETSGVARSLLREGWMGRQIAADVGGCGNFGDADAAGGAASRRVAMRMGAPVWLA